MPKYQREKNYWKNQWLGLLVGTVIGIALSWLFPGLAAEMGTFYLILWSAILGGVLSNLNGFIRAGAALTRSDNRWLNLLVGLGIPALVLAAFSVLITTLQK